MQPHVRAEHPIHSRTAVSEGRSLGLGHDRSSRLALRLHQEAPRCRGRLPSPLLSPVVQADVLQSLFNSLVNPPIKPAPSGGSRFGSPIVALLAGPGWGKSFTVDEIARKTDRVKEVAASVVLPDSKDTFCTHLERTTAIPISFNNTTNEVDSDETACFSLVVRVLFRCVCGVSRG